MEEKVILDSLSQHLVNLICELGNFDKNHFINLCIHHYGDLVRENLEKIAATNVPFTKN